MEIPEDLRELVDRLGRALVQALVTDEHCRELARQIQEGGFEVGLMIEATLAIHRREAASSLPEEEQEAHHIHLQPAEESTRPGIPERDGPQWSEEDRAFLAEVQDFPGLMSHEHPIWKGLAMSGVALPWDRPAPEPEPAGRPNAAGMDREQLKHLMTSLNEKAFRAGQIFEGLYRHRWMDWSSFTALSKPLRARLLEEVDLHWPAIVESVVSDDGSTKHAFRMEDGSVVEGVYMPYEGRATLCLSSQVGCAMGCTFCATGRMGILRNLTAAEITGQVITMLHHHGHPAGAPVNLVFMGMGEPMHNLPHVMAAFRLLNDSEGVAIPPRRVTISTSGLVTGIQRLGECKPRPRLALSLNGTTDEHRSSIMPVNRVWNLQALAQALKAFPLEKGERITLEYVLLKDVTDSLEDGRRLAAFAKHFPSKVNLIPFNPHEAGGADSKGRAERVFEPPSEARIDELCGILAGQGITVSVRRSRGQDIAGACGQLARKRNPAISDGLG